MRSIARQVFVRKVADMDAEPAKQKTIYWDSTQTLDTSRVLHLYQQMVTIRLFEERAEQAFVAGKAPGFVHLYQGEEAVAVGVCANLTKDDYITSHHRGHGHCLAKGVDVDEMVAELLSREAIAHWRKAGSQQITEIHQSMLRTNGIIGGGFPLAVGAGLTAKHNGHDQVAVCFLGDEAINQGTFYESLNLVSAWKLPVIFVAENKGYAETMPITSHLGYLDILERAANFGISGVTTDGLDIFAIYTAANAAIAQARQGKGPSLIECKTYRTKEDLLTEHEPDPIKAMRRLLEEHSIATDAELDAIEQQVRKLIDAAWSSAETNPFSTPKAV